MKNLKKFLPLLVLALLILAACTNPLSKNTSEVQVDTEVIEQPIIDKDVIVPEALEVLNFEYGPDMTCGLLKNADMRQSCEMQVSEIIGMMLESEIASRFDVKRCNELPSGIAEKRNSRLTDSGVQGPVSDEDLDIFRVAMRGTSPDITEENGEGETPFLFPVYDIGKCSQLKTPGYKAYCEKLVTERIAQNKLEQIMSSGDVGRCDELVDENRNTECKLFLSDDIVSTITSEPGIETRTEVPEDETAQ